MTVIRTLTKRNQHPNCYNVDLYNPIPCLPISYLNMQCLDDRIINICYRTLVFIGHCLVSVPQQATSYCSVQKKCRNAVASNVRKTMLSQHTGWLIKSKLRDIIGVCTDTCVIYRGFFQKFTS